jgi:2-amino-4-hydroxy-6-hydroxymethyldihydropteridine diphosphokinase
MPRCLIALGANQGDRGQALSRAVELLGELTGVHVLGQSRWRETAAIGGPLGQPSFLNGAVIVETSLAPQSLLPELLGLERKLGRQRSQQWASRPIDLDLLLYDDLVLTTPSLALPHPRMAFRRFVLEPAADVAPDMVHPAIGWTVRQLLEHLQLATPYAAIAGPLAAGKMSLASALARERGVRWIPDPAHLLETEIPGPLAGRSLQEEIEWAKRRADAIDAAAWTEPGRWAVSDFWLDESIASARTRLSAERFACFQQAYLPLAGQVMRPKLLVLLDDDQNRAPGADRLRESLREQVAQSFRGPVLRLNAADPEQALAELIAALDAMQ